MGKKKKNKFEDMEEMQKVYEYWNKNSKLIIGGILIVAAIIFAYKGYGYSQEQSLITASTKLAKINSDFENKNYERVIADGIIAEKEFSGCTQGGNIMILVAKAYSSDKKVDEAIAFLEKKISSYSNNSIVNFGGTNILAGLYAEKWNFSKNKEFASKAAKLYESCTKIDNESFALESAYNSGKFYKIAGENKKAKTLLSNFVDIQSSNFGIKNKIKKLYKSL